MTSDETTRLRALLEQTEMPWRAVDVVDGGTVLGRGTAILRPHNRWLVRRVAEVDMGDGEECDTSHAALIVAAVNALPGLLDAAERAERERDDLAATLETRNAEHAAAMARVAELEKELSRLRWGVVANAGRTSHRRMVRWGHVKHAVGCGGTRAVEMCIAAGFDPDDECGIEPDAEEDEHGDGEDGEEVSRG